MNRLILVGNGFDLAHGLKTGYNDFILWYLKSICHAADQNNEYSDDLVRIYRTYRSSEHKYANIIGINNLIDHFYNKGFGLFLYSKTFKVDGWSNIYDIPFKIEFKGTLMQNLLTNCSNSRWVEIENEFYDQLLSVLKLTAPEKRKKVNHLNLEMNCLIEKLHEYLQSLAVPELNNEYKDLLNSYIDPEDFNVKLMDGTPTKAVPFEKRPPHYTQIVNFNYTHTFENYINKWDHRTSINYIHGKLGDETNQLVFGFGDELDKEYVNIEEERYNGFKEYIKSFWYLRTSNYHNLMKFVDSDRFQVVILGHSCGLSDRTMLNMVFEHENCKSIKIYYYESSPGNDNYVSLTQEISRHFNNKGLFRKKVVNYTLSSKMPQVEATKVN